MGNQTHLEMVMHVLNDGRTITVTDNKITNISGEGFQQRSSSVSDASTATDGTKPKDEDGL
jgi:hypothetical protein